MLIKDKMLINAIDTAQAYENVSREAKEKIVKMQEVSLDQEKRLRELESQNARLTEENNKRVDIKEKLFTYVNSHDELKKEHILNILEQCSLINQGHQ